MSRTVRRKSRKVRIHSWVLWDWDGYRLVHEREHYDPRSKEGKKAIAKYHSDAGIGDLWYKSHAGYAKLLERRGIRRDCELALHRYFNGIDEECVVPTYKHGWLD